MYVVDKETCQGFSGVLNAKSLSGTGTAGA